MKLSYIHGFGNKGNTFVSQGISQESLPYQANLNATPQYLIPDYFLPASQSESYYSRKYGGNHTTSGSSIGIKPSHQSKFRKISRVASVIMLSLGFLAPVVEVEASDSIELQKEASSGQQKDSTFEATHLSNNLPDVVPTLPLPDLVPSNPPVTPPPPPPPMPPLPDIVPPVILPDVVPVPSASPAVAMALSQPDFVSDASNGTKPNDRSALLESIRHFKGGTLRKVEQEPKPKVVSSDGGDFMGQLYDTLERRRRGISAEAEENNKPKRTMVKQTTILTTEEAARKKAENLARAAIIREQNQKQWAEAAKKNEEIARERRRTEAEAVKARIEQKAKENGSDRSTIIAGIDLVLHNNIVAELRQEISDLKEQLTPNGNVTSEGMNAVASVNPMRSKRSLDGNRIVETQDQSTSTEYLTVLEERLVDEKAEILSLKKDELESQSLVEAEVVEAVEDILDQNIVTDTRGSTVEANSNTVGHQEAFTKRAKLAALAREDLRFGSKMLSKQIRHRLSAREIGSMVAVAAGDEEEEQAPSYSVWSSVVLGGSKQKDSNTILGYSSRIRGVSIGGEINLSSDLMFGASLSRLHSTVKYLPMLNSTPRKTNTNIFSIYSSSTLVENINLQILASVALRGKASSKQQDIVTPKSKLFSFESHLNQKITWGNDITLIPSIGIRYEYGRVGTSRDIIRDSYVLHHKKSKSSTLSGEVGASVLFTPINFSSDFKLIPTAHISLDKRIASTGGKRGQLLSVKDIGGEASVVSSNSNHEKLSTNIGGGLIASHKNISLEFLYDLQKQRSFKSHQGILKLKVNL